MGTDETMTNVLITGAGGLIGSEAATFFADKGHQVIGVDNDMRAHFFGPGASTAHVLDGLSAKLGERFHSHHVDIRDESAIGGLFHSYRPSLVIHTAAQPSHDWAAKDPRTDFGINALGTLNLLENTRKRTPEATFIHCSTSKVYGDTPNGLPLKRVMQRLDLRPDHRYYGGIDTTMSVDQSLHSLFGVSKLSGDLLVQEYGRYFGMNTVCFRPGCLTGPAHEGAELHGFLSYLMRCAITGKPYTVYGYEGLQVRCNIHALDLVRAFAEFHRSPRPGAVYNIGGGRENACSVLEAIHGCERIAGRELNHTFSDEARIGDHRWWISDNRPFQLDYPQWGLTISLEQTLQEIHDYNVERWRP